MMTLALSGLEKALNAYLRLDPDSIKRLSDLKGKIIKIKITDWNAEFFILPYKNGVRLSATNKNKPDTLISGTLFGLFKAGCAKGQGSALFENSVEISGNTDVGEAVRDLMSNIDIDWEEHLSKITGDILAHKISLGVQRTIHFGKFAVATIRENLKDYLQAESQLTPTLEEVESFIQSVTDIQYSVERAEARINRLLIKRELST